MMLHYSSPCRSAYHDSPQEMICKSNADPLTSSLLCFCLLFCALLTQPSHFPRVHTAMAAIPIVDLGAYTHGQTHDVDSRNAVAQQIDKAFRTMGFVYLKNHGVPKEQV